MSNNTATNSQDGPYSVLDEIKAVLAGIGVTPKTVSAQGYQNDIIALETQVAGEHGWYGLDRSYNLLNTSLHLPGADSKAIPDYYSFANGVDANVSTLLHTSGNPYAKAVADLRAGADPTQYLKDIANSPWDKLRYGTVNGGPNKLLQILHNSRNALATIGVQSPTGISSYGKKANTGQLDQGYAIDEGPVPGSKEAAHAAADAAKSALSWTEGLSKLLGALTTASFWKRVGEGAVGVVMILIAIAIYNEKSIASVAKLGVL